MAIIKYGPNGETLTQGMPGYEKGFIVKPTPKTIVPPPNMNNPSFVPDIPNIVVKGYEGRPMNKAEAKDWFKFAKTRPGKDRMVYDAFVQGAKARGIPAKKISAVWSDALDWTQSLGSQTNSPDNYLDVLDPADYMDEEKQKKYGTSRQIQETTTQYSKSKAAADATEATKQELGREASAKEVAAYTNQVNLAAKKEPSIYDATTTTSPGKGGVGLSKTTATNKTGFDPTMFAQNFARTLPDYAESYAAKNFLTAVQKVIGQAPTIEQGIQ